MTKGYNVTIHYSVFTTRFGMCLVASTEKGICNILFSDTAEGAFQDLKGRWPKADLTEKAQSTHRQLEKYFHGEFSAADLTFHVFGTDFQIKVWEALLSIPAGSVQTYGDIAAQLGGKQFSRAVGAAIGDNPIGYIIPCHRITRSNGDIGGYRWGIERKRAMLAYEAEALV